MECKNCGAKIDENSKFCIYCGTKVENTLNAVEVKTEEANLQENSIVAEPIPVQTLDENKITEMGTNSAEPNKVEETLSTPNTQAKTNNEVSNMETTTKKKNNKLLLIILISVLALGILGGIAFLILNNKSAGANDDVIAAFNNLQNVKSATINASLDLEGDDAENLKLSFDSMFSTENDKVNLYAKVNKSMLFDEMNLYVTADKENVGLYTESNVIDLLGTTKSDSLKWIYYSMNLKDTGINFDEIVEEDNDTDDLKEVLDEKHLKYIGKENNLSKYQLIIDKEMMSKLNEETDAFEQVEALADVNDITVDIYLNNNNELVKISIDMSKYLEDYGMKKAILTLELSNINNTKVSVPTNVVNGAENLEKYMEENMIMTLDDEMEM